MSAARANGRAVLRLHPADNVATALRPLEPGSPIELDQISLTVQEPIPLCHKVALADLPAGAVVTKYGQPIGLTTQAVPAGGHVHVHSMTSARGRAQSGGG